MLFGGAAGAGAQHIASNEVQSNGGRLDCLVAGKGAETGQQIGDIVHPFDDRLRLRTALSGTGTKCADDTDGER